MFACIHAPDLPPADSAALPECARSFSPSTEITSPNTIVFSVDGLNLFYSNPNQIANAIAERVKKAGLSANIAVAGNADSAMLAARWLAGVTVLPDKAGSTLARLPVTKLPLSPEMQETLNLWGIRTFGDLAKLPETGLAERLGLDAVKLQKLAQGAVDRPLVIQKPEITYEDRVDLDHPIELLEPLMFVLGRSLNELCVKLQTHGMATNEVHLILDLEGHTQHTRTLQLPFPMYRSMSLLKLLQMDLEAHPPQAPVVAVSLFFKAVPPRKIQGGLFVPLAPEPDKLELTLARIRMLVGEGNVGVPELLNTHRPDAYCIVPFTNHQPQFSKRKLKKQKRPTLSDRPINLTPGIFGKSEVSESTNEIPEIPTNPQKELPFEFNPSSQLIDFRPQPNATQGQAANPQSSITLAFRYCRPPLEARVEIVGNRPVRLSASGIRGKIIEAAGPWRSSGDWWTSDPWDRDEWDVCLSGGALYRIYRDPLDRWFVEGSYD
jgi:protein ImuB